MDLTQLIPRWLGALLLAGAAASAFVGYRSHLIHQGEQLADTRHAAQNAEDSRRAQDERNRLNRKVADQQRQLDVATATINAQKLELTHVQDRNSTLQRDLAAGNRRLLVLTRPAPGPIETGPAGGAAAGGLDPQPAVAAELDPAVGGRLAELTGEGDAAIIRLNACIAAYDAVKAAADAISAAPPAQQ